MEYWLGKSGMCSAQAWIQTRIFFTQKYLVMDGVILENKYDTRIVEGWRRKFMTLSYATLRLNILLG